MKKVNQKEIHKGTGDCMRASIASVLEIDLQAVPHLTRTAKDKWFQVLYYFMISYEYKYCGMWHPWNKKRRRPLKQHSINGYYLGIVNSRSYPKDKNITHMVVIDQNLKVVHDPNPNKKWQGENLKDNPDFEGCYLFRKMNKTDKDYWHYLQ